MKTSLVLSLGLFFAGFSAFAESMVCKTGMGTYTATQDRDGGGVFYSISEKEFWASYRPKTDYVLMQFKNEGRDFQIDTAVYFYQTNFDAKGKPKARIATISLSNGDGSDRSDVSCTVTP